MKYKNLIKNLLFLCLTLFAVSASVNADLSLLFALTCPVISLIVAEAIGLSLVDSIMSIAIDMIQTGQRLLRNSPAVTGY